MEVAMTTRALPFLPRSRLLIPMPFYAKNLHFRPKRGLVYSGADWSGVTASEETSSVVVTEKFEDEKPVEKKEEEKEETVNEAEVKEEEEQQVISSDDESEKKPAEDLLKELSLMLESEDKSKLLIYGTGAFLALWISSIVISAVDSIPLFPKLMEVVGLGYTVWFSSRYLLFKKNRDELFTKIIDLKGQILGSTDE